MQRCTEEQERTMLTILIDARYENLKPSAKVNALENLAGFLGLHTVRVCLYMCLCVKFSVVERRYKILPTFIPAFVLRSSTTPRVN